MTRSGDDARLVRLDDLDEYTLAAGEPDIRGWEVNAADGATLGTVDDLIVDVESRQVSHVGVRLGGVIGDDADRHVVLPRARTRLDVEHRTVCIDRLPPGGLTSAPAYPRRWLTEADRRRIEDYYADRPSGEPGRDPPSL